MNPWSHFSHSLFLKWFIRLHLNLYNLYSLIPILSSLKPPYLSCPNVHSHKLLKQHNYFTIMYTYSDILFMHIHTLELIRTHFHTLHLLVPKTVVCIHIPFLHAHLHFIHQYAFSTFYVHLSYIQFLFCP